MAKSNRGKRTFNRAEANMVRGLDKLAAFEKFQEEILPKLQKMVAEGKSAPEIYEFAQSYAAARMVTEALTNPKASEAIVAVKDLLDRTQGKAKERQEVEHKFEKLKDEELDALLKSRLKEVQDGQADDEDVQH